MNDPKYVLIHCTDAPLKTGPQFWAVNAYHKSLAFPKSTLGYYGGYHIFIEADGTEFKYREDFEEGAHCNQLTDGKSMNVQSLAVCLAGDFDIEFPTAAQIETLKARLKKWLDRYPNLTTMVYHHRHFTPWKTCAGSLLHDDWGERLLDPPRKEEAQAAKQAEIQKLISLLDTLRSLILKLKIALGLK